MNIDKKFSTSNAKDRDYTFDKAIISTSRLRVRISQRAVNCISYTLAKAPVVFSLDPVHISKNQDAIRLTIEFLAFLAKKSGISNIKTSIIHNDRYFLHEASKTGKRNEWIDLTPAESYTESEDTTNFTFTTTQDDNFLLLKSIYKQKGVKSNNHLLEEIIYSMAACLLALDEGYSIDTLPKKFSLKGFGELQLNAIDIQQDKIKTSASVITNVFK